jgi:hypothetical protein
MNRLLKTLPWLIVSAFGVLAIALWVAVLCAPRANGDEGWKNFPLDPKNPPWIKSYSVEELWYAMHERAAALGDTNALVQNVTLTVTNTFDAGKDIHFVTNGTPPNATVVAWTNWQIVTTNIPATNGIWKFKDRTGTNSMPSRAMLNAVDEFIVRNLGAWLLPPTNGDYSDWADSVGMVTNWSWGDVELDYLAPKIYYEQVPDPAYPDDPWATIPYPVSTNMEPATTTMWSRASLAPPVPPTLNVSNIIALLKVGTNIAHFAGVVNSTNFYYEGCKTNQLYQQYVTNIVPNDTNWQWESKLFFMPTNTQVYSLLQMAVVVVSNWFQTNTSVKPPAITQYNKLALTNCTDPHASSLGDVIPLGTRILEKDWVAPQIVTTYANSNAAQGEYEGADLVVTGSLAFWNTNATYIFGGSAIPIGWTTAWFIQTNTAESIDLSADTIDTTNWWSCTAWTSSWSRVETNGQPDTLLGTHTELIWSNNCALWGTVGAETDINATNLNQRYAVLNKLQYQSVGMDLTPQYSGASLYWNTTNEYVFVSTNNSQEGGYNDSYNFSESYYSYKGPGGSGGTNYTEPITTGASTVHTEPYLGYVVLSNTLSWLPDWVESSWDAQRFSYPFQCGNFYAQITESFESESSGQGGVFDNVAWNYNRTDQYGTFPGIIWPAHFDAKLKRDATNAAGTVAEVKLYTAVINPFPPMKAWYDPGIGDLGERWAWHPGTDIWQQVSFSQNAMARLRGGTLNWRADNTAQWAANATNLTLTAVAPLGDQLIADSDFQALRRMENNASFYTNWSDHTDGDDSSGSESENDSSWSQEYVTAPNGVLKNMMILKWQFKYHDKQQ